MELGPRIVFQKLADRGGLMSREIVQDDVNLLLPGAEERTSLRKRDELAAGVVSGGFAMNTSGGRVQGGIKGECSMAKVF